MRLAIVLAVVALASCGAAATAPPPLAGAFQNGDVRIAYAIDLPPGAGPFPGVVLGHGSGRTTREELRWMSSRFTALGFAVLRFDKRGVGESTGTYSGVGPGNSDAMFRDLASDVAAAVRVLRARPEVDPARVGLAGVSQAGWILPLAARNLGDAAFVVLISGPVCSVGLENYFSDLAEWSSRPLDEVYPLLGSFKGPDGFDVVPTLEHLDTPSLWLLGLDDRSIPIPTTLRNLERLRARGRPFQWHTYAGQGHAVGPQLWDDIARWLEPFRRAGKR
jgi:pimeloyl-ACP methyl ester carboxylesterase